jgi:hypothetical protein
MRTRLSWTLLLALIVTVTASAVRLRGQEPPKPTPKAAAKPAPPVLSSRQIDRYDAIRALQTRLYENPNSLSDWIILGELALEVALDLPADQATPYYRMSRQAYQKALALKADQPGLKAALQFARDHEANAHRFEEARDRAINAYLEARRRDLAATDYMPSLPLYGVPVTPAVAAVTTPAPASPVAPAAAVVAPEPGSEAAERAAAAAIVAADPSPAITPPTAVQRATANYGTRQFYSSVYPNYHPYYFLGAPYTYSQYTSNVYFPAATPTTAVPLPITAQRYYQGLMTNSGWVAGTTPYR